MRELSLGELAARDEVIAAEREWLAADQAGDELGRRRASDRADAAWDRLVVASGRRPTRFRWVVGVPAANGKPWPSD